MSKSQLGATKLREQAREFMKKAEEEENKIYVKIGKIVKEHHEKKVTHFNLERFKLSTKEILDEL